MYELITIETEGNMDIEKEKDTLCHENNSVKEVTRRILKLDGNSLTLAVGFLVCIVLCITPIVAFYAGWYLLSSENIFLGLFGHLLVPAMLVGFVFLFLPVIVGYMSLARDTANGKGNGLLGLFSVYTGPKKYFKSVLLSVLLIVYVIFVAVFFVGGFVQFQACAAMVGADQVILLIPFWLCTFIAAAFVLAYIASCVFFVPYIYLNGGKLKGAIIASVKISAKYRLQIIKLEFSYLLHLLVGILSLGVLLVIRSAPKISVSYFVFCNRVFDVDVCGE